MAKSAPALTRRAILVLRSMLGGDMSREQFKARLGCVPEKVIGTAIADGYVEAIDKDAGRLRYRLTESGRAALPPRNPVAALTDRPMRPNGNTRGPSPQRRGGKRLAIY